MKRKISFMVMMVVVVGTLFIGCPNESEDPAHTVKLSEIAGTFSGKVTLAFAALPSASTEYDATVVIGADGAIVATIKKALGGFDIPISSDSLKAEKDVSKNSFSFDATVGGGAYGVTLTFTSDTAMVLTVTNALLSSCTGTLTK